MDSFERIKNIDEKTKGKIIDMLCEGTSATKIADKMHLNTLDVKNICRRYTVNAKNQRKAWLECNGWDWGFAEPKKPKKTMKIRKSEKIRFMI